MTRNKLLAMELDLERDLSRDRQLSIFRRNPSTWELLLYLAQFEDGSEDGVYRTLDRLETQYLGSSALLKFMHERRDDGLLLFTEHSKRSKWRIALNGALREALFAILERRHAGGKESVSLLETIRAQPGKRCD